MSVLGKLSDIPLVGHLLAPRDLGHPDFVTQEDFTIARVRRLKDDQLHWALVIRHDALQISMLEAELRRREASPARWAVGMAFLALLVSVVGLFVS